MSTPMRPLWDLANERVPGWDRPRCCENKNPLMLREIYAKLPFGMGEGVTSALRQQGVNVNEYYCPECSTFLERLRDSVVDAGPMFVAMVATAASFVPGFGTAISMALNAGLALADGKSITDSFLAGAKGAMPGGVITESAIDAGMAIAQGKEWERVAIAALPIPEGTKDLLDKTLEISLRIARGDKISQIVLDEAYSALPENSQRAIDAALAIKDGRSPEEIVTEQMVKTLPPELGVSAAFGVALGAAVQAERAKDPLALGRASEDDRERNDALAKKGQAILQEGAAWTDTRTGVTYNLQNIRRGKSWTFTRDDGVSITQRIIDAEWRRGFDIAVGVSEGSSVDGPGQLAVRASLHSIAKLNGFDAGKKIQHDRTKNRQALLQTMARMDAHALSYKTAKEEVLGIVAALPQPPDPGQAGTLSESAVISATSPGILRDESGNRVTDSQLPGGGLVSPEVLAQMKAVVAQDILRRSWVNFYKQKKAQEMVTT